MHVVDEVVVAGEDHFEGTVLRFNVIDLDDGPAGLHSTRNSQISAHAREFNLQTSLLVRVKFEYSLVGQYRLKIKEFLPRLEANVVLERVNLHWRVIVIHCVSIFVSVIDQADFSFPRCSRNMFTRNYEVALASQLHFYLEIAGVFFAPWPVKLHVNGRRSVVERPGLLDRLIIVELVFVELDSIPGQVNGRLAQRSQVAPSHGQKHVSVQSLIVLEDQRFIALENLEENDDVRVADVGRVLVDDELLVPEACISAILAHVVELGAER